MEKIIYNDQLTVRIKSLGAELTSIKDNCTKREYVWQSDNSIWGRQAPNLFPIIGELADGCYCYGNQNYYMNMHGFAKDMNFMCVYISNSHCRFYLRDSEETKVQFPFRFELYIDYILNENQLMIKQEVKNPSSRILNFSIGGHPGFKCDYNNKKVKIIIQSNNIRRTYRKKRVTNIMYVEKCFEGCTEVESDFNNQLIEQSAIFYETSNNGNVHMYIDERPYLSIQYNGYDYIGLWSKPNENFICIEPTSGIGDTNEKPQELSKKPHSVALKENESKSFTYIIKLHK